MSKYTPTTEQMRDALAFAYAYGLGGLPTCAEDNLPHEVISDWLAEVECAAAEKAWDVEYAEGWNERDSDEFDPRNPYRRNEGGVA